MEGPKAEVSTAGIARWNRYKAEVVTAMLRELRLEYPGKTISVRFPYSGYEEYGLDIRTWVSEGLDTLIPATIGNENFFEFTAFADVVNNTDVQLYIGMNYVLSGHDLTKAEEELIKNGIPVNRMAERVSALQYQLRAFEAYQAGANGIYIFNNLRGTNSRRSTSL